VEGCIIVFEEEVRDERTNSPMSTTNGERLQKRRFEKSQDRAQPKSPDINNVAGGEGKSLVKKKTGKKKVSRAAPSLLVGAKGKGWMAEKKKTAARAGLRPKQNIGGVTASPGPGGRNYRDWTDPSSIRVFTKRERGGGRKAI